MKKIFFAFLLFLSIISAQSGDAGKFVDQAYALLNKSDYKAAEKLIFKAFRVSEVEKDDYNKIRSIKLLGTLYYNYRELEASISFYKLSLGMVEKLFSPPYNTKIELEVYNIKNNLAIALMESDRRAAYAGKLSEAEKLFGEVLDYYEKSGDRSGYLSVLLNLGILYRLDAVSDPDHPEYAQKLSDALTILLKANDLAKKEGNTVIRENILFNLGISYQTANKLDSAAKFVEESITSYKASGNKYWEAIASLRLGYLYLEMSSSEEGNDYREKGIILLRDNLGIIEEYRSKFEDERGRAVFLDNLTYYYVLLINELYEEGDYESMFDLAEMVKSRSFVDMLSTKASGVEEDLPDDLKKVMIRKSEIEAVFRDSLWLYFEDAESGRFFFIDG